MTSRAARRTLSALALLALAGGASVVATSERSLLLNTQRARQVDLSARDAVRNLAETRAALQAYVAAGQSASFWVPKVASLTVATTTAIDQLRPLVSSDKGRQALLEASAAVTELGAIDRRAREYLSADALLMASDVVFSDGFEVSDQASQRIEVARQAEFDALDAQRANTRRWQATAGGVGAGLAALVLVALGWVGRRSEQVEASGLGLGIAAEGPAVDRAGRQVDATTAHDAHAPAPTDAAATTATDAGDSRDLGLAALAVAADVSTEFGKVQSAPDLKRVLAHAAHALNASGIVVWVGSTQGDDLRPVVAHGYSDQVLSLMRAVPRHADNAAATAYRTAALQIVPAKPGTSLGAVVAPILAAEGCIGALTAEVRDNGEVNDTVHLLAAIFASQLAGVLSAGAQSAAHSAPNSGSTASNSRTTAAGVRAAS